MIDHMATVWRFRHFWMSLVRMDLRTRYRRSVLGIGWSVLNPVLMSIVIVIGFGKVLGRGGNVWDYGAFLLPGLCTWEFLRNSTTMGCDALVHNEAYIRQCPLPYSIYTLRTILSTGVHYLITLAVTVLISCVLLGVLSDRAGDDAQAAPVSIGFLPPHEAVERGALAPIENLWVLPGVVAILFVFAWGSATVAAFAAAYFPDVKYLIDVAATMMFFLTPIMIPIGSLGTVLSEITPYNPIFYFLELVRHPLYYGTLPPWQLWAVCAAMAVASFLCGSLAIKLYSRKVIFQL